MYKYIGDGQRAGVAASRGAGHARTRLGGACDQVFALWRPLRARLESAESVWSTTEREQASGCGVSDSLVLSRDEDDKQSHIARVVEGGGLSLQHHRPLETESETPHSGQNCNKALLVIEVP